MNRTEVIAQSLRQSIVSSAAPRLSDDEITTLLELLHKMEQSNDVQGLSQLIIQASGAIQRIASR